MSGKGVVGKKIYRVRHFVRENVRWNIGELFGLSDVSTCNGCDISHTHDTHTVQTDFDHL